MAVAASWAFPGALVLKQPNYAGRRNYSKARLAAAAHVGGGRMAMRKGESGRACAEPASE
jgi:hypothetical protein